MRISLITAFLITGISVYFILSHFLIPQKIIIPLSFFMSLLSFGLSRYYFNRPSQKDPSAIDFSIDTDTGQKEPREQDLSNLLLVFLFVASILICFALSQPNLQHVYTNWFYVGFLGLVTLGAGIMLSFFLPGYAILLILTRGYKLNRVLKIVMAYLFSMLITGLSVFLSGIFIDSDLLQNKNLLIAIYFIILVIFVTSHRNKIVSLTNANGLDRSYDHIFALYAKLKSHLSEIIVFVSLFALLLVSTNYLYGGITIGDQWYHQSRIIYFMSGHFKDYLIINGDDTYPLLQSSLLAGTTLLSGIPLVNTYASIAFLNIMALFSFYYFCSAWFPQRSRRAALLACSFFLLASGFGWLYLISLTETSPITSQLSSISKFLDDKIRFTDIIRPTNFMIAAHPDFSTGLIYISLPAGFTLLGFIRANMSSAIKYIVIIFLIAVLGLLSHDEFYVFVLLSSTLPLIYNMQKKYFAYFGLLIALGFTYAVDLSLPVRHYTTNDIFGVPLIVLSTLFILLMLSLYIIRQNKKTRSYFIKLTSIKSEKKFVDRFFCNNLLPRAIFVGTIFYLYVLCFVVWDQLPASFVVMHTQNYSTPWYIYPVRLGIIGLIGVVSILSFIFKKYEKQVFVFGILSLLTLFEGPYYDEQRFNKYLMVGMIGFASLLVYKLLLFTTNKKPVFNGVIISSILIFASMSSLLYVGYNALIMEAGDSTHALGRRNFPPQQELGILDMVRSKILANSSNFNIASFPVEYNFQEGGIMTKLHAFSGLPVMKIPQTHYMLSASSLDSFFNLLEKSGTRYIILPTNRINEFTMTGSAQFASDNFEHIYNDSHYIILKVPRLHGPSSSSQGDIGVVYRPYFTNHVKDSVALLYSNNSFSLSKNDTNLFQIQNENKSETATLSGYKKIGGKTIWSENLPNRAFNYIETSFKVTNENNTANDDIAGIKWLEGNDTYIVSISDKGLQLRKQPAFDNKTILLSENAEIKKDYGVWYSLKITSLENSINIYLDDVLKMKFPRISSGHFDISKVAINSVKNVVEFKPLVVGKTNTDLIQIDKKNSLDNSYLISSLALSGFNYTTYSSDDGSVLSKNIVMLPFDPVWNNVTLNTYLNYVRSGGTLIVSNSDANMSGTFAKLLSINVKGNSTLDFDSIVTRNGGSAFLNISGHSRDVQLKSSNDTKIMSYYVNQENKSMVPFAIEKQIANSGRIIYINSQGYFEAVYSNPIKYFSSLKHFFDMMNLKQNESSTQSEQNVTLPIKRFIGKMEISGKLSIKSPSFLIVNTSESNSFEASEVRIFDKNGKLENYFNNLSILDMDISGKYEVSVDSTGHLILPGTHSQRDYVQIPLPNGFNMTLALDSKSSKISLITGNRTAMRSLDVSNQSLIVFSKVASYPLSYVPVILKDPLISVDGNSRFEKSNFYGDMRYIPLSLSGHVEAKIDFVDDLQEIQGSSTKTQYISYLGSLTLDGKINQKTTLKIPGGISSESKNKGLGVPIISILSSPTNIVLIIIVSLSTVIMTWLIKRKIIYKERK